jgi:hypothetical protein
VTVQKALFAADHFVGVLRAGIAGDPLDRVASLAPEDQRIFICDGAGRLVTRLAPGDPYLLVDAEGRPDPAGDALRVVPRATPAPIVTALALARAGRSGGRMVAGGEAQLSTLVPVAPGRAPD